MAQTPEGARKTAAKRLGLTIEEYQAKVDGGLKHCTKCKQWIGVASFNVDRSRGDGLTAKCRRCGQTTEGPSQTERKHRRASGEDWCRGCKVWKPLAQMSGFRGICFPCVNRERRVLYATNPAFRYKLRQFSYRRKRNVDAVPPHAETFLTMVFDGECAYCGKPAESWDHIVPVSTGGKTTPGNILPACQSCNSSKGDQEVWDWMEKRGIELNDRLIDRLAFAHVSLFG